MNIKRYFNKRIFAMLICLSMVLNMTPLSAFAVTTEDSLCDHHTEHTADCGYVAAVAGSPCTHVCGEACVDGCVHSVHDDTCGYIAGTVGTPCTYDCQEDHGTVTDQPEATTEPSVPETTEDAVPESTEVETVPVTTEGEAVIANQSADWCGNPLCSQEDAFHVTSCTQYVRPENPQCYCVEKCTEPNVWCDVCGFDHTACGGTDTAAVYADCTHATVTDGICTECQMYGWCGAPETEGDAVTDKVIWAFDESTGTLTISGSGATADYVAAKDADNNTLKQTTAPWSEYKDSITKVVVGEGITVLGNMTFRFLSNLTEVSLPDSLTKIGTYVFGNCSSLQEVSLPGSLEEIGMLAFLNCSSLTEIVIPDSVHTMGLAVFGGCSALSDVKLSSSLTMIPQQTFLSCTSLRSLTIPANVKEFGGYVFSSCDSLTTLIYLGDTPPTCSDHIVPYGVTIYVPCTYNGNSSEYFPVTIGHFEAETGESNLTYSVDGNSIVQYCNHCQTTDTATLVIEENKAYDGENKVSVVYTDGWIGGELDVIEAIQPGNYTASISYGDYTVSETFEIAKNQLTITAKDQTITYGESIAFGADQVDAVLGTGDTLSITLTPSTDEATKNGEITPSDAKITNASGVDVTDNYIITYETGKLIINKSEPVITFNAEYTPSKTYDGIAVNEPTVENITVSAKYDGNVIFTWYKDAVAEGNKLIGEPVNAGTYILVASIAETENNNAATKELTVSIGKAGALVTDAPTAVSDLTYTGKPQALVSSGEASGGTLVYSTTQDGTYVETIPTGTNAGSYKIWYKVRGDGNHSDSTPVMLTAEIAPADASGAVVTVTGTYSYTSKEITPAADEVIVKQDGKTLTYDKDYTFEASNNIEVGTDTAIITVTFKGNYTGTATGTFTIEECPHSAFEDKRCTQCGGICGVVKDHAYTNGICVNGCYQPATDENQDGTYEISNAGQLYWFAGLVNGTQTDVAQKKDANAVLTADITMPREKQWTPIGYNTDNKYAGTFDGQNHTISGLYFNDTSADNVGLFGCVNAGTIKNVGVVNAQFQGSNYVGGISGQVSKSTIENCYVSGTIVGTSIRGGIVASAATSSTIKNCYFFGNLGTDNSNGGIAGSASRLGTSITNCYYLSDSENHDDSIDGTTAKTSDQFASGEVAYLLNGTNAGTDAGVWKQIIRTDSYPTFTGNTVYRVTDCKGGTTAYSNDSTATGVHNYVNGTCTLCGATTHTCGSGELVKGQAATCTADGWNDYYQCSCGKIYEEANCSTEITDLDAWKSAAGKIEATGEHSFDDDCDTDCNNGCGYTRTTTHDYGELIEATEAVHSATELKGAVAVHYYCTVCGTYFTEDKTETTLEALTGEAPTHTFGDEWQTGNGQHWKECSCGAQSELAVHTYDATTHTCVCGDVEKIVSVTITWGAMSFTYDDTLDEDGNEKGWTCVDGANVITVENTGNTDVTVTYTYEQVRTEIEGSFTDGTNTVTKMTILATEKKSVWLNLKNKPTAALTDAHLGTVKLTIE